MKTVFILVAALLLSSMAQATLGEGRSSIARDAGQFKGKLRAAPQISNAPYTVQEFTANANTIREYLTPDGVVFAITWRGITVPDLATLFGSYYADFQAARESSHSQGRRHLEVQSDKIVVSIGGHQRDIHGKSFIPSLVPAGVHARDLQ